MSRLRVKVEKCFDFKREPWALGSSSGCFLQSRKMLLRDDNYKYSAVLHFSVASLREKAIKYKLGPKWRENAFFILKYAVLSFHTKSFPFSAASIPVSHLRRERKVFAAWCLLASDLNVRGVLRDRLLNFCFWLKQGFEWPACKTYGKQKTKVFLLCSKTMVCLVLEVLRLGYLFSIFRCVAQDPNITSSYFVAS